MAVTFATIVDGQPFIDGVHNVTVSNQQAQTILSTLGLPTTVPGQAPGADVYPRIVDYQATPEYAALPQSQQDAWEQARITVALAYRFGRLVDWR